MTQQKWDCRPGSETRMLLSTLAEYMINPQNLEPNVRTAFGNHVKTCELCKLRVKWPKRYFKTVLIFQTPVKS